MNLFHHRPLFLVCSTFMAASVGAYFLSGIGHAVGMTAAVAVAVLLLLLWRGMGRHRPHAMLGAVCALAVAGALLASYITFCGTQATRLHALSHQTVVVTGTVTDRRTSGGYMTTYTLSMECVDGQPADGAALLVCQYVSDLQPGYAVTLDATVLPLEEVAGDGYDAAALRGDGYCIGFLSEHEGTVTVTDEGVHIPAVSAGQVRRALAARLNRLVGDEAAGLPAALLLGDKSTLADEVRRDFSRTGVSHLLAISGLHMTLLFGLLEGALRICHVPKRVRAILLAVSAAGYLVLLGFPPSATRAVIMLGVTYLSHLLTARADPLTSLGVAGALILAITPYAVADAGFWMSYMATLGLLAFMPPINRWVRERRTRPATDTSSCAEHQVEPSARFGARAVVKSVAVPLTMRVQALLLRLLLGLTVGVVAMSLTLLVTAAVIGEMSLLSPVTTLLLTPLCAVVLVASLLSLPLGGRVLGTLAATSARLTSEVMCRLATGLSKPSWVVVSLRHPAILPIAGIMTAALLVLMVVRLPKRRQWIVALPLLIGWMAIGGVRLIDRVATAGEVDVTYLQPSTQSDALVLVEGRDGVICDLSNGSLTALSAAAREAENRGATELAVLMLTHYHSRTAGALTHILGRETVRALWLPRPMSTEDYYRLLACLEAADRAGVPAVLYDVGDALTVFGDAKLMLESAKLERSVQPLLLLSFDTSPNACEAERLVYIGSAVFESTLATEATAWVAEADTVIFGNHGPLPHAAFGENLIYRSEGAVSVILSAYGDTAAYLQTAPIPTDAELWLGQKRFVMMLRSAE